MHRTRGSKRRGAKTVKKIEQNVPDHQKLTPEEATTYRALSARCNYLSQDRPGIAFCSKELCRDFSVPSGESLKRLQKLIRYLLGVPRLVYKFNWQSRPEHLDLFVDTDFAGCKITRRSTSGGVAMYGTHCLRHWSSTQPTIALGSGEA